jgi:hypothetical protein
MVVFRRDDSRLRSEAPLQSSPRINLDGAKNRPRKMAGRYTFVASEHISIRWRTRRLEDLPPELVAAV